MFRVLNFAMLGKKSKVKKELMALI